jgi:hypothetical protein
MKKPVIKKLYLILLTLFFVAWTTGLQADEVTDTVNEALENYKEGHYSDAVANLNYASQLIQQKKGEDLKALLPEALKGWSAEEASSQAVGVAMMGGGVTAERRYQKEDSNITIQIITDSPILQGVMMMISNPMFAASDGGKVQRINQQRAIVKYSAADRSGSIQIVVANRFLVSIEGYGITGEDLEAYAKAMDYKKMEALP